MARSHNNQNGEDEQDFENPRTLNPRYIIWSPKSDPQRGVHFFGGGVCFIWGGDYHPRKAPVATGPVTLAADVDFEHEGVGGGGRHGGGVVAEAPVGPTPETEVGIPFKKSDL